MPWSPIYKTLRIGNQHPPKGINRRIEIIHYDALHLTGNEQGKTGSRATGVRLNIGAPSHPAISN